MRATPSRDTDALRREQELVDRFRLRLARTASRIALIVVAALAFYVLVQPPRDDPLTRALLWVLLAVAAAVSAALHARSQMGARPIPLWAFYLWIAGVLLFDSAVLLLHGDPMSDVYLAYLLPVLFAATVLPTWGASCALAFAVFAYLAVVVALDGDVSDAGLVLRAATFAVVGILGAYLAREQQREIGVRVQQEQQLSELLEKVISAQEDERKRIARELHDGPLQAISMVNMRLGLVEEMPATEYARSQSHIGAVREALGTTLGEVRLMIQDLRPSALDDLGLVTAAHDLAASQCDAAGLRLRWEVTGPAHELPPAVETAVFRILQEGVNNAVRHAHAHSVRVAIAFDDGHLCAVVEDDGVGFDPQRSRVSHDGRGVGLLGMRERAALLGGSLAITSAFGRGTRLRAEIPIGGMR
jgi:signal transduction histidine kinase